MKKILFFLLVLNTQFLSAQKEVCIDKIIEHSIQSEYLNENRNYWVSLPIKYSNSIKYPVIYVLDAEWRFDLIKNISFDLGANDIIQKAIIVGIPHIDWDIKRGKDLTFSQSGIEYDGEKVDSTWYNDSNSGHAKKFYEYFMKELIPSVNANYSTNDHETLIGHSYGGYFGGYILSMEHPFEVLHLYDPSIWFSNGEVISRFKKYYDKKSIKIHLTYQPEPQFHREKIESFIEQLKKEKNISLTSEFYKTYSHNALFLDSFYQGILLTNK